MDSSRTLPGFDDFDNPQVYSRVQASIRSADALNFVIEFDTDTALAATDLSAGSMENLLNVEVWSWDISKHPARHSQANNLRAAPDS